MEFKTPPTRYVRVLTDPEFHTGQLYFSHLNYLRPSNFMTASTSHSPSLTVYTFSLVYKIAHRKFPRENFPYEFFTNRFHLLNFTFIFLFVCFTAVFIFFFRLFYCGFICSFFLHRLILLRVCFIQDFSFSEHLRAAVFVL